MTAVSPDGTRLIFAEVTPKTGFDIMQLRLDGAPPSGSSGRGGPAAPNHVTPLVQTAFSDQNGLISPDGRWLAYEATDSGQSEVYVGHFQM